MNNRVTAIYFLLNHLAVVPIFKMSPQEFQKHIEHPLNHFKRSMNGSERKVYAEAKEMLREQIQKYVLRAKSTDIDHFKKKNFKKLSCTIIIIMNNKQQKEYEKMKMEVNRQNFQSKLRLKTTTCSGKMNLLVTVLDKIIPEKVLIFSEFRTGYLKKHP